MNAKIELPAARFSRSSLPYESLGLFSRRRIKPGRNGRGGVGPNAYRPKLDALWFETADGTQIRPEHVSKPSVSPRRANFAYNGINNSSNKRQPSYS